MIQNCLFKALASSWYTSWPKSKRRDYNSSAVLQVIYRLQFLHLLLKKILNKSSDSASKGRSRLSTGSANAKEPSYHNVVLQDDIWWSEEYCALLTSVAGWADPTAVGLQWLLFAVASEGAAWAQRPAIGCQSSLSIFTISQRASLEF